MEDFTNTSLDIGKHPVPSRRAPLPPIKMSKQPTNQSRYSILSSKIFQPNLRRHNAMKKKSAPPRPPPPTSNNMGRSQSIPSFAAVKNFKSSNFNSVHSNNRKFPFPEACLIDFSSPPNSPYAGSGSDGVSINSFGSENSSNNQSASEDIFDPFGLICEEPRTAGFSSFYNQTDVKPTVKQWDDDDPFKEIALRHDRTKGPQPVSSTSSLKSDNIIPKSQPVQPIKSTFYAMEENSSKPFRTTIIRPKNQAKIPSSSSLSNILKSTGVPSGSDTNDAKKLNNNVSKITENISDSEMDGKIPEAQIAEILYDFVASEDGDLSLQAGQNVVILKSINDDWLYGKTPTGEGMFPASFVKIIVSEPTVSTTAEQETVACDSKIVVKALYTFCGEFGEDLSLQEGENVCILGRVNDDWLYGEARGLQGQFPANFVDGIPSSLPQWVTPS